MNIENDDRLRLYDILGLGNIHEVLNYDRIRKEYENLMNSTHSPEDASRMVKFVTEDLNSFAESWRSNPYDSRGFDRVSDLFSVYNEINREIPIYTICTTVLPMHLSKQRDKPEYSSDIVSRRINRGDHDSWDESQREYKMNHNIVGGFATLMKTMHYKTNRYIGDYFTELKLFREYRIGMLLNEVIKQKGLNFKMTLGYTMGTPPASEDQETIVNLYRKKIYIDNERISVPQLHIQYIPNTTELSEVMRLSDPQIAVNGYVLNYSESMIFLIDQILHMIYSINQDIPGFIHGSLDMQNIEVALTHDMYPYSKDPLTEESYSEVQTNGLVYIGNYSNSLISRRNRYHDKIEMMTMEVSGYENRNITRSGMIMNFYQFLYNLMTQYSVLNYHTVTHQEGQWVMRNNNLGIWIPISFLHYLYILAHYFFGNPNLLDIARILKDIWKLSPGEFRLEDYPAISVYPLSSLRIPTESIRIRNVLIYSENVLTAILNNITKSREVTVLSGRKSLDVSNVYSDDTSLLSNYYILSKYCTEVMNKYRPFQDTIRDNIIPRQSLNQSILQNIRKYLNIGIYQHLSNDTQLLQGLVRGLYISKILPELNDMTNDIAERIQNLLNKVKRWMENEIIGEDSEDDYRRLSDEVRQYTDALTIHIEEPDNIS